MDDREHDKRPGFRCWCGQYNALKGGIAWVIYLPLGFAAQAVLWSLLIWAFK